MRKPFWWLIVIVVAGVVLSVIYYATQKKPPRYVPPPAEASAPALPPSAEPEIRHPIEQAPQQQSLPTLKESDPAVKEFLAWMKTYRPNADTGDLLNVQGYTAAQLMPHYPN